MNIDDIKVGDQFIRTCSGIRIPTYDVGCKNCLKWQCCKITSIDDIVVIYEQIEGNLNCFEEKTGSLFIDSFADYVERNEIMMI